MNATKQTIPHHQKPVFMRHSNQSLKQQQQCISQQAKETQANHFLDLLHSPNLLDIIEDKAPEYRERHYPPTLTLSMFLRQTMSADSSCQNAVNEHNVNRALMGLPTLSSSTGGYCSARQRLPLELIRSLVQETGHLLSQSVPSHWLWKNRQIKLVDGTTITLADSKDNQKHYPQHGNQAQGVGFPLARLVGVISLATGALLGAAIGPHKGKGTGEHSLFRECRDAFEAGDLMLADSYYCSYFLIAHMQWKEVDVVFEQHGARLTDFRRGKKIGPRDHQVAWDKPPRPEWMSKEEYETYPDQLEVRELKVRGKVLVTTLLSVKSATKNELGELFIKRWHVEVDLRDIKSTLGMEVLKCKTAEMCEKEMWVYFLAHNLIRILIAEAARQSGVLPRELSFKHTLQIWIAWNGNHNLLKDKERTEVLLSLIAEKRVGNRPNRIEPRAVKRRPKPFLRLTTSRQEAREQIIKNGHGKKLELN